MESQTLPLCHSITAFSASVFTPKEERGGREKEKAWYKCLSANKESNYFMLTNHSSWWPFFFRHFLRTVENSVWLLSVARIFLIQTYFWLLVPSWLPSCQFLYLPVRNSLKSWKDFQKDKILSWNLWELSCDHGVYGGFLKLRRWRPYSRFSDLSVLLRAFCFAMGSFWGHKGYRQLGVSSKWSSKRRWAGEAGRWGADELKEETYLPWLFLSQSVGVA